MCVCVRVRVRACACACACVCVVGRACITSHQGCRVHQPVTSYFVPVAYGNDRHFVDCLREKRDVITTVLLN